MNGKELSWISVADKLPEKSGKYPCVLVTPRGTFVKICTYYTFCPGYWVLEYDGIRSETVSEYVTHWLQLPELPNQ